MMIMFGRKMQLVCELNLLLCFDWIYSVTLTRFCIVVFCRDGTLPFWTSQICASYCSTCPAFVTNVSSYFCRLDSWQLFLSLRTGSLSIHEFLFYIVYTFCPMNASGQVWVHIFTRFSRQRMPKYFGPRKPAPTQTRSFYSVWILSTQG